MKLKARKYMRYNGKAIAAGDVFEPANKADARILVAIRHAEVYVEPSKVRGPVTKTIVRALEAEQTVSNMPADVPDTPAGVVSNVPAVEAETPKRHYKRRDMTAE
jgi:hypothetical protein